MRINQSGSMTHQRTVYGVLGSRKRGFTIVELLIVVVLIAILATITIVAYNGLQKRAQTSAVSTALNQAGKKVKLYQVDNNTYPTTLASAGIADDEVTYQYTGTASTFCITGTQGNTSLYLSDTVTKPTEGGCPGHGQGGVAAVTNLATNPSVETNGTGWANRWYGAGGGAGTLALTSVAAHSGTTGYRKTWTVGGGGQDVGMSYTLNGAQAGKTYTFSAYIRASVVTGHKPLVEWYDAASVKIGSTIFGAEVSIPANTWQRLTMTQTAPANTASARYIWGPYPSSGTPSSVAGQTVDFDSVMIVEGSSIPAYADPGINTSWAWTGAPNASTSTGPAS